MCSSAIVTAQLSLDLESHLDIVGLVIDNDDILVTTMVTKMIVWLTLVTTMTITLVVSKGKVIISAMHAATPAVANCIASPGVWGCWVAWGTRELWRENFVHCLCASMAL